MPWKGKMKRSQPAYVNGLGDWDVDMNMEKKYSIHILTSYIRQTARVHDQSTVAIVVTQQKGYEWPE